MPHCKSLNLKQLAQHALDLQAATKLEPVVFSWADMLARIRELAKSTTDLEFQNHPINVLLAHKIRELTGNGSEIEHTRAFYKVRELAEHSD